MVSATELPWGTDSPNPAAIRHRHMITIGTWSPSYPRRAGHLRAATRAARFSFHTTRRPIGRSGVGRTRNIAMVRGSERTVEFDFECRKSVSL